MNPELEAALMDLYKVCWDRVATYECDIPGYVLVSVDDDQKINDACERIESLLEDAQ